MAATTTPAFTLTPYPHEFANMVNIEFHPNAVRGDLRVNEALVGSPDVECCPFRELVVGDTLCALGFRSGGRRKVRATRVENGRAYVLVQEGWYRWPKVYTHVI